MRAAFITLLLAAGTAFAHPPISVVVDARGNVYYSDLEQVLRLAPDGKTSVVVPNVHTHELFLDAQGNLYGEHLWYEGERTDKWGHYVWKRDTAGKVSKIIPRTEGFRTNYSFVRDAAGTMYWAIHEKGEIRKRTTAGAITRVVGELKQMRWLYSTPAGTLYVVDGSDLVRIKDGRATRFARNVVKTSILRPFASYRHAVMGVWTDRAENVYYADFANGEVKRVTQAGQVSTIDESPAGWSPTGGTFTPNGDLWILETSVTNQVRVRKKR